MNTVTMKKSLLLAALLLTSSLAHAQLRPPVQTDTLKIKSVKYNYAEINKENWICTEIYKSGTEFIFGDQRFTIEGAHEGSYETKYAATQIQFKLNDDNRLSYYENPSQRVVVFSGYEFICDGSKTSIQRSYSNMPTAQLSNRTVVGTIPRANYPVKDEGKVVVTIWVDPYGTVKRALAGADGTTTVNQELLSAARNAAMQTHFSPSGKAPALQEGTITYDFRLW